MSRPERAEWRKAEAVVLDASKERAREDVAEDSEGSRAKVASMKVACVVKGATASERDPNETRHGI